MMHTSPKYNRVLTVQKILQIFQANMHSGHGFAYDTMRRAEVYSRHQHHLEAAAAGQDSLSLQHSLASSAANLDHQVRSPVKFVRVN